MIGSKEWGGEKDFLLPALQPGTVGHLFLFLWSLAVILLTPGERMGTAVVLCLLAALLFYPRAFARLWQPRWLLLAAALALPPLFLLGERTLQWGPLLLSPEGLATGLQMAGRAAVIVVAVEGFAGAVSISETAALFERVGLKGLGFALGVALNLLPILRESFTTSWHSLRMRGGFRRQRLRAARYLLVTVVGNAIRRAEAIALAAETRAFSPEKSNAPPLRRRRIDLLLVVAGSLAFLFLLL
jgi:energy-coupling factor transporter transmembrane protein EcfT